MNNNMYYSNCSQIHNHEVLGSTMMGEECEDRHNHRFATVSGIDIPLPGGNHVHELYTNTDFFSEHHHHIEGHQVLLYQLVKVNMSIL